MGLLDSVSDRKKDKDHLVTSKENIDDEFSKNMFGTEEVTLELRNGVRNRLTENEMRRIREEAGRKRKYKKGKKHRKGRH